MGSHKQEQGKGKIPPSWELCVWTSHQVSQCCGCFQGNWGTEQSLHMDNLLWCFSDAYPSKLSMLLSLAHFSRAPKGCNTGLVCKRFLLLSQHWLLLPESHCWITYRKWKVWTERSLAFPYLRSISEFVWIVPWFLQPAFLSKVLAFLPQLDKEGAMWLLPPGEVTLNFALPWDTPPTLVSNRGWFSQIWRHIWRQFQTLWRFAC